MGYTVLLRPKIQKFICGLPLIIRRRIVDALFALRDNPFPPGSIKLQDGKGCHYRIRVGAYRVVYEVAKEIRIITVIRVGHRREVYRVL